MRPYLEKNPSQKRAGGMAQGVGPEFKSQYCKNDNIPNLDTAYCNTSWLGAESCSHCPAQHEGRGSDPTLLAQKKIQIENLQHSFC
jgi:hypothetical protein